MNLYGFFNTRRYYFVQAFLLLYRLFLMVGKWFKINELCILHTKNVAIFVKQKKEFSRPVPLSKGNYWRLLVNTVWSGNVKYEYVPNAYDMCYILEP